LHAALVLICGTVCTLGEVRDFNDNLRGVNARDTRDVDLVLS
jgi:hypothetical protein